MKTKQIVILALVGIASSRKMMYADDFDEETNGGEAHPAGEEIQEEAEAQP